MASETVTFKIDSTKRDALDAIAGGLDRDRSYVINQAIDAIIEVHRWHLEKIDNGLAQAARGELMSDDDVQEMSDRLT